MSTHMSKKLRVLLLRAQGLGVHVLWTFCVFCLLCATPALSQREVAITIDDVPNVKLTLEQRGDSRLLHIFDSARVPVTIFINEGKVDEIIARGGDSSILEKWVGNSLVRLGNHSYSHCRSSSVGVDSFLVDIANGARRTKSLARRAAKTYNIMRFPYNDCGADSLQQDSMETALRAQGYRIMPFSVESSDYMFNLLYQCRLDSGRVIEARAIGQRYVEYTMQLFSYIDSVAEKDGITKLRHIFLGHDNRLHRDFMPELLRRLREQGYRFVSLDDALQDKNYQRPLRYRGRAGISWVYRWIAQTEERRRLMRSEPDIADIEQEYERLQRK